MPRRSPRPQSAKVFEGLGIYAPTLGIIGAVLGLIAVMKNLADPSKLGHGIAAAFTATIYGIGLANLFFLPIANKLKDIIKKQTHAKEMIIDRHHRHRRGREPAQPRNQAQGLHGLRPAVIAMARKHEHEDHVNHEAWAIPYGDLVTLLLAFFVVMYAVSSVNEGKYRVLSDSLQAAFHGTPRTMEPVPVGDKAAKAKGDDTLAGHASRTRPSSFPDKATSRRQ